MTEFMCPCASHPFKAYIRTVRLHSVIFFFNDTATTEIYTLSLHDALPISGCPIRKRAPRRAGRAGRRRCPRSEEHTSELQSRLHLVCRLLLEKKKKNSNRRCGSRRIMVPLNYYPPAKNRGHNRCAPRV